MGEAFRVAIVGAGPAGCMMAAALLDAARLRRRSLQIHLFGARSSWGPDRPLVLDEASVATLTSIGIPLPPGQRLEGTLTFHGKRTAALPSSLRVLPRNRLVGLLRSALHTKGASLTERRVTGVAPLGDGRWVVRADGGSYPVDAVVLACGAGATLPSTIGGHRPPPAARAIGARLPSPPRRATMLRRHPRGPDDLWLVPLRDGMAATLVGPTADPRGLGLALLELGLDDPAVVAGTPDHLHAHWVSDGWARPALPCVGNALGGDPAGTRLSDVAHQAHRVASALLEGGMEEAVEASRGEARALGSSWRRSKRASARLRRFPEPVRERALRVPKGRTAKLPTPTRRALAGEPDLSLLQAIAAFLLLLWTWIRSLFESRRPRLPAPTPRSEGEIFVVEDDPAQAEGLCALLRQRGLSCSAHPDALHAAQAAASRPPAALVLDLALPWVDGVEALRAFRRSRLREVPVFVTSALSPPKALLEDRPPLAEGWFEKPLDLQELARKLALVTSMRGMQAAEPPRPHRLPDADRMADDR